MLCELLKARAAHARDGIRASIGTKAAPVQSDIEKVLLSLGKTSAKVPSHPTSLADLGLDEDSGATSGGGSA